MENSVEDSSFMQHLMRRREISPELVDSHRNGEIRVESFSEQNRSTSMDGSEMNANSEKDHIKVESNEDTDGEKEDEMLNNRLPDLDDISERPEKESEGQSSMRMDNPPESDPFYEQNRFEDHNQSISLTDEEDREPVISSEENPASDPNYFLNVPHLSPPTRSNQTLSDFSGSQMSPPASTFGIRSSDEEKSSLKQSTNPKTVKNGETSRTLSQFAKQNTTLSPQQLEKIELKDENSDVIANKMSPI